MRTRKMTDHLEKLVDDLRARLEEQRLQIAVLEEAQERRAEETTIIHANQQSDIAQVPLQASMNNPPRIPDLIRMIPEFDGSPRKLPRWIESVEQKLNESKKFVPQNEIPQILPIWVGIIRDKIIDKANDVLSAGHTPLDWNSIKNTLTDYFGDKSDLSSLVSKLTNLKQGSSSVAEFHYVCRSLLAEINAKISLSSNSANEAKAIMGTYETLMINAFVDGLHDTVSDLTRSTRPQSLQAAYQVASEQEAAMRRRRERNLKQTNDVLQTKRNVFNVPAVQQRPFYAQGNYPMQPRAQNPNTRPFVQPAYKPGLYYQQTRPVFQQQNYPQARPMFPQQYRPPLQNSNPVLAIKQEASSNQSRNNNRPTQNINIHEESESIPETTEQPQYSNQNFPYHGMAYVSTSESNIDYADAVLDTDHSVDYNNEELPSDQLNFHILEGPTPIE